MLIISEKKTELEVLNSLCIYALHIGANKGGLEVLNPLPKKKKKKFYSAPSKYTFLIN